MTALVISFALLCATYWLWSTIRAYERNKRIAIETGLPVILLPVNVASPLWLFFGPLLIPFLLRLPFGLGSWANNARPAWHLKRQLHAKYGRVYVLASPTIIIVNVADPDTIMDVAGRRGDFQKPAYFYKIVDVYGKNVVTTDGHDWMRYRRITGPPFSERNNSMVWRSALEQTRQMVSGFIRPKTQTVALATPQLTMERIALHVISTAAYGIDLPFHGADETGASLGTDVTTEDDEVFGSTLQEGFSMTFLQSLHTLLRALFHIMLVPKLVLKYAPVPIWNEAYLAFTEFKRYTKLLMKRAREVSDSRAGKADFLRALAANSADDSGNPERLTDDELLAHLYIFTFAGHETTAHTLSYAIINLALHQEVQDWFLEQLDNDLGAWKAVPPLDWEYAKLVGTVPSVTHLMNETLRLFPVVAGVPKWTADAAATLNYDDHKILLPPKTAVILDTISVHRDPELWGADAEEFRPQRWHNAQVRRGQFIPFSEGARACLGKKFAEVEILAVIASLFSRFRVELVCHEGESLENARRRTRKVFDQSILRGSLRVLEEVPVRLVPR